MSNNHDNKNLHPTKTQIIEAMAKHSVHIDPEDLIIEEGEDGKGTITYQSPTVVEMLTGNGERKDWSTKEEILEKAHLSCSSNLARQYFLKVRIDFSKLKMSAFDRLADMINIEIAKLSTDADYQMIDRLKIKDKIKKTKDGIFLIAQGSYFKDREGISFYTNPLEICFCGWASGCNRIPFIVGFVNWVDYIVQSRNGIDQSPELLENI